MKIKHLYVCLLSLGLIWIVVGVSGFRKNRAIEPAMTEVLQANTKESSAGPVRNVRFTLFEQGIRPAQMRINAGLVTISIEDTTTDGSGLVIERVDGDQRSAVASVRNRQDHSRGRSQLRVTPGTYELQDAVRPAHKAVLIVEP